MKKRVLTGINTTGTLHIGNYVGAIRPAIQDSKNPDVQSFFFMADLHALIKCQDPDRIERSRMQIAATWLAAGLDPERVVFYRQSDIPEIPLLNWMLTCCTSKGQMNRLDGPVLLPHPHGRRHPHVQRQRSARRSRPDPTP